MHLFVDQLTNVDFSYLDVKRGMVGETWWASVLLDGALDDQGMVCDFGIVKKTLRNWLDNDVDHRLLLPILSPALTLEETTDRIDLSWTYANGKTLRMKAPRQAVALVNAEAINADSVSQWCREQLREFFPVNIEQLNLSFESEVIDAAFYHYSHGLKKHDGNCQRIAHGHRSRLKIFVDDQRSAELERQWARDWADIYLGSKEDVVDHHDGSIHFRYSAQQGEFELWMPESDCYLMNTDTTVEFIARHLAEQVKKQKQHAAVKVQAFEGVNKGAIAGA